MNAISADSAAFDRLHATLAQQGAQAALDALVEQLRADRKYFELFDALLMRGRCHCGLPIILTGALDDLAEPMRGQVEQIYLEACREVGLALLAAGQVREGWMYLRPVGDVAQAAQVLEQLEPTDENLDDLIAVALHEGVAIGLGYRLVLERYGTCNAITMFEAAVARRSKADQQAAAALLVRHLHGELLANVRAEISRQEGRPPTESTLAALVADRDWLFGQHSYHIDTTHLASTMRYARVLEEEAAVRLALDLAEYGRRLHPQFQFAGDPPFANTYPSHALYFQAVLGQNVPAAVAYFRERAEQAATDEGPLPAEVLVALLARVGRWDEAIEAAGRWLPPGTAATGFAPNLMELSRRAGRFDVLLAACRERGDLVGYAAALLEQAAHAGRG